MRASSSRQPSDKSRGTMTHRYDGSIGTFGSPSSPSPARPPPSISLSCSHFYATSDLVMTKCGRTELHCESFVREEAFGWSIDVLSSEMSMFESGSLFKRVEELLLFFFSFFYFIYIYIRRFTNVMPHAPREF